MGRRLSNEDFIKRSADVHNNFYDYSETKYTRAEDKVKIICPLHGVVEQKAMTHMLGFKPKCCVRILKSEYLKHFHKTHGDLYDYSEAVFRGCDDKISILCKTHGSFLQSPIAHRKGEGCPSCAAAIKGLWKVSCTNEFVEKAVVVHGDRYDYSSSEYKRSNLAVDIKCNCCGVVFKQTPNAHLAGKGCRNCNLSGFTHSKSAYFYVLTCDNITKVGITNKTPSARAYEVSKSCGKNFSVLYQAHIKSGKDAQAVEGVVLKELRSEYRNPLYKFDGYTECFVGANNEFLIGVISGALSSVEMINQNTYTQTVEQALAQ